jgi:hypothetical protein
MSNHYLTEPQIFEHRQQDGITAYTWIHLKLNREDFLEVITLNNTRDNADAKRRLLTVCDNLEQAIKYLIPSGSTFDGHLDYFQKKYVENFGIVKKSRSFV